MPSQCQSCGYHIKHGDTCWWCWRSPQATSQQQWSNHGNWNQWNADSGQQGQKRGNGSGQQGRKRGRWGTRKPSQEDDTTQESQEPSQETQSGSGTQTFSMDIDPGDTRLTPEKLKEAIAECRANLGLLKGATGEWAKQQREDLNAKIKDCQHAITNQKPAEKQLEIWTGLAKTREAQVAQAKLAYEKAKEALDQAVDSASEAKLHVQKLEASKEEETEPQTGNKEIVAAMEDAASCPDNLERILGAMAVNKQMVWATWLVQNSRKNPELWNYLATQVDQHQAEASTQGLQDAAADGIAGQRTLEQMGWQANAAGQSFPVAQPLANP